jgi:hypothetical protein
VSSRTFLAHCIYSMPHHIGTISNFQVRVLSTPGAGPAWRKEVESIHAQARSQKRNMTVASSYRIQYGACPELTWPGVAMSACGVFSHARRHQCAGVLSHVSGCPRLLQPLQHASSSQLRRWGQVCSSCSTPAASSAWTPPALAARQITAHGGSCVAGAVLHRRLLCQRRRQVGTEVDIAQLHRHGT